MQTFKALLLPLLLILSLIEVDRFSARYRTFKYPQFPVGAGLLAKAADLSIPMQADPPLSRASPLPQGIYGVHTDCTHTPTTGR
ncbi:hypothetical protein FBY06_11314 [Pseudomonas sp. SJZ085]|nr:hypothetical protein FBY00_11413 [Pseudomonas sp. SJZ075]TWC19151.1 hypothetical protein FBX99_113102 [Pseudomonas sp. SJZ074]TWC30383.1 hypothetical protein FBY02_1185 [Pseudomonas sp. SJZ078]TWC36833.1 hypothetical protein FBY06_11314 [Pseudomonas sp. SJZ085]TWC53216.1 hypothetical protein FBY11_113102 [Pseudomonas sp. SJZ124]TWC80339.1 hypothetical protein FBY09_15713 [Pseudomonas sp. SJZ101]